MNPKPSITEKVQKVLARAGLASRRTIEQWIREGRVKVNRQTAHIGDRVSPQDEIRLNGQKIVLSPQHKLQRRILCYHKPIGEVCTRRDPEGRPTVFDHLPTLKGTRWITVGRLDINTAGLLIVTSDGELAHRLMHPSYELEREYAVRVLGTVSSEMLNRLTTGVQLEEGIAKFDKLVDAGGEGANHWYHVTLAEGKKREVRRLWESQGITVSRLIRIRFGPIQLPKGLRAGHYVKLDEAAEHHLLKQVGLI